MNEATISIDFWSGSACHEEECAVDNDISKIDRFIRMLDGDRRTLVSIHLDNGAYMLIGGGAENQYIVTGSFGDEVYFSLVDAHKDDAKTIGIIAGGQYDEYPARMCNTLDAVVATATTFVIHGALDTQYCWEEASLAPLPV